MKKNWQDSMAREDECCASWRPERHPQSPWKGGREELTSQSFQLGCVPGPSPRVIRFEGSNKRKDSKGMISVLLRLSLHTRATRTQNADILKCALTFSVSMSSFTFLLWKGSPSPSMHTERLQTLGGQVYIASARQGYTARS